MVRELSHSGLPADPTVERLIRHGAALFADAGLSFGHGTDNPVDEAAALVFFALQLDHSNAAAAYLQRPTAAECDRVLALFRERIERRVPAAYLMGRMWFAGREFVVDPRVIVPRSPFAELLLAHFEPWADATRIQRVLDIGTGSGCIAIACALEFPQARVDAVDVAPDALEVARANVALHAVNDRVELLQGDVYGPLAGRRYDIIVANPPYVSDKEMAALPREYRSEPDLALRAGAEGLDVVRRILAGAEEHLEPHGVLFVEVGDSEERLQRAFPRVPFLWLEFEHGGGGVFALTRHELEAHRESLRTGAENVG